MSNPLDANPSMEIHNEEIEELLAELGHFLGYRMPEGWGFMLNLFSFGPGGSTFYISNAQRGDMVKSLRELADTIESRQK